MGLITGIRIIHLRVRDKVAYPDLTLDLAGDSANHLVVGLENGGGKSTLLGAVYHVFVPETDEFLPRRAQKRQGKDGQLKKLEQYVPGGDPTHFIVEVEIPASDGTFPLLKGPRLLIGACLWKAAGAPPSTPASEFFWSARSVNAELTLKALGVRGANGRLLDHREFRAKLKQLRTDVPAAQVNIEDLKGAWQLHLGNLGIDVEFVRQFLLRMNEDEGAADQVFTYASSRAFLNSLVGVVGDPSAIAQLKQGLTEMAGDADTMLIDRQRATLLERLVAQTGPLAESVRALNFRLVTRDQKVDHLLCARQGLNDDLDATRKSGVKAEAHKAKLDLAVVDTRNTYNDANARFVLARVQVAKLRQATSAAEINEATGKQEQVRTEEQVAHAAALLADRRTAETRIRDIDHILNERSIDAEPLRAGLSSAVQALDHRLTVDSKRLANERKDAAAAAERAAADLDRESGKWSTAERKLGGLDGERQGLGSERTELERQLTAAIDAGLLASMDTDPAVEARRTRVRGSAEHDAAEEHELHRLHAVADLAQLAKRELKLARDTEHAEHAIEEARAQLDTATSRTKDLAAAVDATGFVEIHPIVLDDHSDTIAKRLESIVDTTRLKQAAAAVGTATTQRAATWLRDSERLPPRTDVERLCERARVDRLGARPGWAYLSTMTAEVAATYAATHPGLADGIVVNVPEDFDAVVIAVTAARDDLDGPVVIGMAAAFDAPPTLDQKSKVVLPHAAHWSTVAGRELTELRTAEAARWRDAYDAATAQGHEAARLREQLAAWVADIGPNGLETRRAELERRNSQANAVADECRELAETVGERTTDRDTAETERDAARDREFASLLRAQGLDVLTGTRARLNPIATRLAAIDVEEADAIIARDAALASIEDAKARQRNAATELLRLAGAIGEIDSQRNELAGLIIVAVRPNDPISPADKAADRQLLTRQVHDRENRWRGAITDPELRAQLEVLQSAIAEIEGELRQHSGVIVTAEALVNSDPARSAADYRADAKAARDQVETLLGRIGALTTTNKQHETDVKNVLEEFSTLRRSVILGSDEVTGEIERAESIRDRLKILRDGAMAARTTQEQEHRAAVVAAEVNGARVELLTQAEKRLTAAMKALIVGGSLIPAIDPQERMPDPGSVLGDPELPEALVKVLRIAGRPIDETDTSATVDVDRAATNAALDQIDADIEHLREGLAAKETRAVLALEAVEALLRDASEKVVRGDQMIQILRGAPRRKIADLALEHHNDIYQRLTSTKHHVAKFDARVDALAGTVYATIAGLLREVRQTVRDSQLPNTRAMGRWAGADLLKLIGLDTLKVEERRAAISATLRVWFDPEQSDRRSRRFDSDDVVSELLCAVTPNFAASILIPSDPLDPEHKPVDHLALETSGGEGVTVALILASLLASRRALKRGHKRTTLMLDNPFAKVTKPEFLRLARDVADELGVQLIAFTGIRDLGALSVFPRLTQLRVSRRENANFVVPYEIDDDRLQSLLRDGTLYVSPTEWEAAQRDVDPATWPLFSAVTVVDRRRPPDGELT